MDCLTVMPSGVVMALLTMQPRLEAEEAFDAVTRASMAAGTMPAEQQRAVATAWSSDANPEPQKRKASLDGAIAHGIPVRKNPRARREKAKA